MLPIYDGPIEYEIYCPGWRRASASYLTYRNGAVELVDTSNPYSPTLTGSYSSTLHAYTLRQAGDLVLLGASEKVAIVDFSNPLSPPWRAA